MGGGGGGGGAGGGGGGGGSGGGGGGAGGGEGEKIDYADFASFMDDCVKNNKKDLATSRVLFQLIGGGCCCFGVACGCGCRFASRWVSVLVPR